MSKYAVDDDDIWTEKVWRVRSADGDSKEEVGPVSLDQVRRGIEAGKLDAAAKVARHGSDNWLSAKKLIDAAITRDKALVRKSISTAELSLVEEVSRVQLNDPDLTTPGQRMPVSKSAKADRSVAQGALVLLALLAVTGACWLSFRFIGPRPSDAAINPRAEHFPRSTVAVIESAIRDDMIEMTEVPNAYVSAWLARHVCGGIDIEKRLRSAKGESLSKMHDLGVVMLSAQREWWDAMRCGDNLRSHLLSPRQTTIVFEHGKDSAVVVGLRMDQHIMPEVQGRRAHTFSGLTGFCQKQDKDENACQPLGLAGLTYGQTSFFGSFGDVEAFAAAITSAHHESSSNQDTLAELAEHASNAPSRTRLVRPSTIPWDGLCEIVAPRKDKESFMNACFPRAAKTRLDDAVLKTRGILIERESLTTAQRVHWSSVLLARSREAGRWIEDELLDLRRDWLSLLVDNESMLIRSLTDSRTTTQQRLWAAASDAWLRALRHSRVSKTGAAVRWELSAKLDPEEQKLVREAMQNEDPEEKAMRAVLEAMALGTPIPIDALAVFLGDEIATWSAAPRATEGDCRRLLTAVESVSVDPNALNLVGLRDSLIRTFDPKQCVGTPLPESYRACLLQASSLQALEACKPPRSPFVKHAQRRLQGQWTVSNVDGSKSSQLSYLLRASLQRCRLELDNQKIAFDCLEDGGVDVLGVEAQDTDKAVLLSSKRHRCSDTLKR
ncbi:MAG TPA: hypothetical protein PL065_02750 [Polyangiaceae bacterium]|nr:hypothetical protein [Polyangiaceae bacterium]